MTKMFYVLYSPVKNKFLDAESYLVSFDKAERFDTSSGREAEIALKAARDLGGIDIRYVGPCNEGDYK